MTDHLSISSRFNRMLRWFELILWELRIQGWGRHLKSRLIVASLLTTALVCSLWAATLFMMHGHSIDHGFETTLCIASMQTPLADGAFSLGRGGSAFTLLRLCAMLTVILARFLIPGVSGSSVAADRRTGRLAELRTTLYSSTEIVWAKTFAASAIYIGAYTAVLVALAPVLIVSDASPLQIVLLTLEMAGSVLLIAALSVTCSVLVSYGNYGRAVAYIVCWPALAVVWAPLLTINWFLEDRRMVEIIFRRGLFQDWYIMHLIGLQIAANAVMILVAGIVSVRRLFPNLANPERKPR